jgi:hypothetical protein
VRNPLIGKGDCVVSNQRDQALSLLGGGHFWLDIRRLKLLAKGGLALVAQKIFEESPCDTSGFRCVFPKHALPFA